MPSPPPKKNFNLYFPLFKKINSKCSIDFNIKFETIVFLEENIGDKICDLELDKDFLDMTENMIQNGKN